MVLKINAEMPFQVLAHSFGVYSEDAYTLNYSVDGINYTAYEEGTPAGEVLFVNGVPKNAFFKLMGNTSQAKIIY